MTQRTPEWPIYDLRLTPHRNVTSWNPPDLCAVGCSGQPQACAGVAGNECELGKYCYAGGTPMAACITTGLLGTSFVVTQPTDGLLPQPIMQPISQPIMPVQQFVTQPTQQYRCSPALQQPGTCVVTRDTVNQGVYNNAQPCGQGIQTRYYSCFSYDPITNANSNVVDQSFCGQTTCGTTQSNCEVPCPVYVAPIVTYGCALTGSSCSVTCGQGVQTTRYACVSSNGAQADPFQCQGGCASTQTSCNQPACYVAPTYSYQIGQWGSCSETCVQIGAGATPLISRQVACVGSDGSTSYAGACAGARPESTKPCAQLPTCQCPCVTYSQTCSDTACPEVTCGDAGSTTKTCTCTKKTSGQADVAVDCCFCSGSTTGDCLRVKVTPCPAKPPCTTTECESGTWSACSITCSTSVQAEGAVSAGADFGTGIMTLSKKCFQYSTVNGAKQLPTKVQVGASACGGDCQTQTSPCYAPVCKTYTCERSQPTKCPTQVCGACPATTSTTATCYQLPERQIVAGSMCLGGCASTTSNCPTAPPCTTYKWETGQWSACSLTCGVTSMTYGTKTRTASCMVTMQTCSNNGPQTTRSLVGAQLCNSSLTSESATSSQCWVPECATYECQKTQIGSCAGATCGCSFQTYQQSATCYLVTGPQGRQLVDPAACPISCQSSVVPCPPLPPCTTFQCSYDGTPSQCQNAATGANIQCVRAGQSANGVITTPARCLSTNPCTGVSTPAASNAQCTSCTAKQTQCTVPQCTAYTCTYEQQGACSATCGVASTGVFRRATCMQTPQNIVVDSTLCNTQCVDVPVPCPALPCCETFACNLGTLGACSTTCGNGVRAQAVVCMRSCNGVSSMVDVNTCNARGVQCATQSQPCAICPPSFTDPVSQLVPVYMPPSAPQYSSVATAGCQYINGNWVCPPGGRRSAHSVSAEHCRLSAALEHSEMR